jgi:hypothetical protein
MAFIKFANPEKLRSFLLIDTAKVRQKTPSTKAPALHFAEQLQKHRISTQLVQLLQLF